MNPGYPHQVPGGPRIPPPPSRVAGPRGRAAGSRLLIWFAALAAGAGLGFAVYQFTGIDFYFDYWLALLLG